MQAAGSPSRDGDGIRWAAEIQTHQEKNWEQISSTPASRFLRSCQLALVGGEGKEGPQTEKSYIWLSQREQSSLHKYGLPPS